ncbi:RdRP-domain-containing protein [Daedaleopsis nitida]|nr:RdRP-domain-containing protein [Daedaleopsis nitida]
MLQKTYVSIYSASCPDGINFTEVQLERYPSSRATRLVDDPSRFLLLSVQKTAKDDELRRNMPTWIRDGITIHGVRHRFLGFTESHVKAGKLMFLREDDEWTVPRLLSNFGDLPAVYMNSGYGKYSARLGLSFSSTVQSLDVPPELVLQVPDLVAQDGSLHSDGCGMIRDSFATEVCTRHGLPPDTTVLQIRRGGIKGLLVRYPDERFDSLCQRHCAGGTLPVITYRPSMYKYDGGPTVLELNNHNGAPAAARLNFQFTALLLTLGVPLDVFMRLVQDQLDLIGAILTDRDKALGYIKGELDAAAEDSFVQGLYAMLLAGQNLSEPQVQSRLQAFQRKQYESLRKKMNLRIQDSGYLFGVVDEYGILGPDEVYINLPSRGGVLVRDVIVSRNPSYHPGDIRKLHAVDHPELRHHRNCIVFSSTASHSVPDTIASGDLDGDTYFVTWDPTLLPETEAEPFARGPSVTAAGPSTPRTRRLDEMPADAVETFIPLRYNRVLGMIANEWSRRVETTAELASAPHVVELVSMIESALDIMKSGEDLTKLESKFKRHQSRYSSQSFSGFVSPIQRLRDMIPQLDRESNLGLSGRQCDQALILRDEEPTRWNDYLSEARQVMRDFNRELSNAIRLDEQFGCGQRDQLTRRIAEEGSQLRHDREDVPRCAERVKQDYQRRYFGGGSKKEQCEQRLRASAWYFFGYTQNKPAFSWIGERYLNEIKACECHGLS